MVVWASFPEIMFSLKKRRRRCTIVNSCPKRLRTYVPLPSDDSRLPLQLFDHNYQDEILFPGRSVCVHFDLVCPMMIGSDVLEKQGRSMSTGSSSGSQSSIASRAQTFGGIRRDMSAGSLSQMADGNSSDGFKVQLRPTPKPTDFAGTSSVTMDKDSNDSDTVARAKKMMNAHTTRIALMEKSNAIAKAGRESMTMRKTSASGNNLTEIPRAAPSPPLGSIANVMTRSASGSDLQNNSIAQLRSKFGALSTEDGDSRQAPNSLNGKPVVPNRPPILQSNQSYTPPRVPSRDSSPSQTRNATPTHPFRLPTQVTEHSPAEQEQEQLLKPSDLRKAQPAPFTAKPFELAHQSAPTLPTRRPNENTTGTALGLPKAVETNSTVVPTTTSKPPPRPVPTPPRPKPQVREDVRAVVEPLACKLWMVLFSVCS